VQTNVKSRALATPPGSPANGDRWIVPSGATGVWTGQTDKIAFWRAGAWAFFGPAVGWRVHVEDERLTVAWTDGSIAFSFRKTRPKKELARPGRRHRQWRRNPARGA
jgi:hypothetical protein